MPTAEEEINGAVAGLTYADLVRVLENAIWDAFVADGPAGPRLDWNREPDRVAVAALVEGLRSEFIVCSRDEQDAGDEDAAREDEIDTAG